MAISEKTIKKMQKDIRDIKRQLAREHLGKTAKRRPTTRKRTVAKARSTLAGESERVDDILRAAGLLSKPTAKEKQLIAEWNAIPIEERTRLVEEFRTAKFDKPLSDIVIENRR